MNQKYIVTIGYTKLAFDDKETAMRLYMLLVDSTPVAHVYSYSPNKAPESLKDVSFVRAPDVEIELKRVDANQFALHLTESEYVERCKPRPTEVDGEARLIEDQSVVAIAGPSNEDDIIDAGIF
jgi:hypothetical protein